MIFAQVIDEENDPGPHPDLIIVGMFPEEIAAFDLHILQNVYGPENVEVFINPRPNLTLEQIRLQITAHVQQEHPDREVYVYTDVMDLAAYEWAACDGKEENGHGVGLCCCEHDWTTRYEAITAALTTT